MAAAIDPGRESPTLPKAPTGIQGLDEITGGGLPRGRPTLVAGAAGCGKTVLAMEFLVRGATRFDEPGVFVSFEETPEELAENVRSLGFDVEELVEQGKLSIDHVRIERSEIEETGEYDLEGLFIRLSYAIDSVGARRVVLDTLESLFGGFTHETLLRAELRRLLRWLKDKGVTAVITGERGGSSLTRHGLEEYVSDCVIVLDHRVQQNLSTRRLRIVKYRGSVHGTNEYPFLIARRGIVVLPITSLALAHPASEERISTGVAGVDAMLGGRGIYRGSSVLISGTAGTGKTSLAAHFAAASCERGERCLYLAFEESPGQILRNMRSVGLDLEPWIDRGLLHLHATRPTAYGLESHLVELQALVHEVDPRMVVVDPITNFTRAGTEKDAESMLMRVVDALKSREITAVMTSLAHGDQAPEKSHAGISSLIDTWILLRDAEMGGERNRGVFVLKSRGMAHSNQIREFVLSERGVELQDVYVGPEGVLTGSMRRAQESREQTAALARVQDIERRRRELERRREALEAEIEARREQVAAEERELEALIAAEEQVAAKHARPGREETARAPQAESDGAQAVPAPEARKRRRSEVRR